MQQIWSADQLSVNERVDVLRDCLNLTFCSIDAAFEDKSENLEFHVNNVLINNISILRYTASGVQTAHRSYRHIRSDHADDFILYVPIDAEIQMDQCGRSTRFGHGQFAFVHTGRPFSGVVCGAEQRPESRFSSMHARIPGPLLRERLPLLDNNCNEVFSISGGSRQILLSLLRSMLEDGGAISEWHFPEIQEAFLNVVCAATEEAIYERKAPGTTPQSSRDAALARIKSYILANLSNPGLTTTLIANQCNVSVRHLHSLFAGTGQTVANWVKEQRLQKCREALRNQDLLDKTITEIAFTWGFNDASHFSRSYKWRYGISPKEDRNAGTAAD